MKTLALLSIFLAAPAMADYHEQPTYNWTRNLFIAPSISYEEKIGGGLAFAYQFPTTRVMLSLGATYTYDEDVEGTVSRTINCRRYQIPYRHEGEGRLGVQFTVAIPLGK